MAKILHGAPVIEEMNQSTKNRIAELKASGVVPTLAIIRVGKRAEDTYYENNAIKRCNELGAGHIKVALPIDATEEEVENAIIECNEDNGIHGILLLRPLPKHLDDNKLRNLIDPAKDVDGCTDVSLAGVFAGEKRGFPPCTPHAAMRILNFYGYTPVTNGEQASVIGRSLVIGRPVAMMLLKDDFTVNICHSKTANLSDVTKRSAVLIAAAGRKHLVTENFVNEDQVVIDVGVNWDEEKQGITGDVDFDKVEPIVKAITPVPGGVGTVTTSILVRHVVEAAERALNNK
ncbi:MAG: bifunctional 5,10-methylenetetrahydrofolate dehydrogenase/5,10-methenyltetrahydrofolate cyclohydrolase [Firmicutes bacterium]|nr:bifunctional 5,10-methylenetetrahydrofolate dehydrogenase/5,10-methenyltetrahydrofolate cyclohydrolase [Bacillota bacterium]